MSRVKRATTSHKAPCLYSGCNLSPCKRCHCGTSTKLKLATSRFLTSVFKAADIYRKEGSTFRYRQDVLYKTTFSIQHERCKETRKHAVTAEVLTLLRNTFFFLVRDEGMLASCFLLYLTKFELNRRPKELSFSADMFPTVSYLATSLYNSVVSLPPTVSFLLYSFQK